MVRSSWRDRLTGLLAMDHRDRPESRGDAGLRTGTFHQPHDRAARAIRAGDKDIGQSSHNPPVHNSGQNSWRSAGILAAAIRENILQAARNGLAGLPKEPRDKQPDRNLEVPQAAVCEGQERQGLPNAGAPANAAAQGSANHYGIPTADWRILLGGNETVAITDEQIRAFRKLQVLNQYIVMTGDALIITETRRDQDTRLTLRAQISSQRLLTALKASSR